MDQRMLGAAGPVSAVGLGCMGMSGAYGPTDRAEAIDTVHAALDAGVTLVDTGDFYGMGHNELLVREAIGNRREEVVLSVKFGAQRGPDGSWHGFDARPAAVKTFLAYSLQRLGTDYIDVYRPTRLDPTVPIEDTVGAIGATVAEVAMAWVLAQGADVVPVIGARTPGQLDGVLRAVALELDDAQLAAIEAAVPTDGVAGTRYGAPQMAGLDSERPPSAPADPTGGAAGDRRG